MSCDRAEALIEQEGGMRSLFCQGSVEVVDGVAGRTVTGDDASYGVDDGEITFHGSPVVMIGDTGEQIEGATLVYDLGTGAARIERGAGSGERDSSHRGKPASGRRRWNRLRQQPHLQSWGLKTPSPCAQSAR